MGDKAGKAAFQVARKVIRAEDQGGGGCRSGCHGWGRGNWGWGGQALSRGAWGKASVFLPHEAQTQACPVKLLGGAECGGGEAGGCAACCGMPCAVVAGASLSGFD